MKSEIDKEIEVLEKRLENIKKNKKLIQKREIQSLVKDN